LLWSAISGGELADAAVPAWSLTLAARPSPGPSSPPESSCSAGRVAAAARAQ
jgi:hypothetical protein